MVRSQSYQRDKQIDNLAKTPQNHTRSKSGKEKPSEKRKQLDEEEEAKVAKKPKHTKEAKATKKREGQQYPPYLLPLIEAARQKKPGAQDELVKKIAELNTRKEQQRKSLEAKVCKFNSQFHTTLQTFTITHNLIGHKSQLVF